MKTSKKALLYKKGLRILSREMHRLDLKSQGKKSLLRGLNSFEIADLVKMMRPLTDVIKEDTKKVSEKKSLSTDALVQRAKEILREYEKTEDSSTVEDAPSGNPQGHDGSGS